MYFVVSIVIYLFAKDEVNVPIGLSAFRDKKLAAVRLEPTNPGFIVSHENRTAFRAILFIYLFIY